jgi:hypothetical protein
MTTTHVRPRSVPKKYTTAGVIAALTAAAKAGNQDAAEFLAAIQVKPSDLAVALRAASDNAMASDVTALVRASDTTASAVGVRHARPMLALPAASDTVRASDMLKASDTIEASDTAQASDTIAKRRARHARYDQSPKGRAARSIRRATR